jgi:hypothetical protein
MRVTANWVCSQCMYQAHCLAPVNSRPLACALINVAQVGCGLLCTQVYEGVVRWWFLCALEPACIAPTRDLYCSFDGRDKYASCHRYDQSAVNILLAHHFNYDDMRYFSRTTVMTVNRGAAHQHQLYICVGSDGTATRAMSKDYFR